jgi:hypothetical protein
MKIKVEKILKAYSLIEGIGKESKKPYKIYQYGAKGLIDGVPSDYFLIKTGNEDDANKIQSGGEFEVVPKEYNGETTYMVKSSNYSGGGWKNGNSGYQRQPRISIQKFQKLVAFCLSEAKKCDANDPAKYFDKILGTASVLLEFSPEQPKEEPKKEESNYPAKIAETTDEIPF